MLYASRWHNDNSGYAFLADGTTGRYIAYPPKHAKEGTKMAFIELIEGGTLEQAILRTSQRGTPEMVHYRHSKPGDDKKILKATYLSPLKSGSVLVSGKYLDHADGILLTLYQKTFVPIVIIILFVIFFTVMLSRHLKQRTAYISQAMSRLAQGDLRESAILQGQDEMAFLANELNTCQKNLSNILSLQANNGSNVATASLQIDTNLKHTNQLIHSELDNLDQLASAMEEMVCSVNEVAENANLASIEAQATDKLTSQGDKQIQQCIVAIEELCSNLDRCTKSVTEVKDGVMSIDSLVDTIRGISEQTNLLALNAAIEAARAGEHGRGFAVVADEVRQLASRTQDATRVIAGTIEKLNTQALSAVSLVDQSAEQAEVGMNAARLAGNEFFAITEKVSLLNDIELQIATAAEEQSSVAHTMSVNINLLNSELAETGQDLDELACASNSLKEQTNRLNEQLSLFDFEENSQSVTETESTPFSQVTIN